MAIEKTCKQCNAKFEIADEDLEFYKKISPTFDGKTFEIPPPDLCPDCRQINMLAWRNERSLYKRKSDKTGEEMVSKYSPDKQYIIWSPVEWWQDDWDGLDFGIDYNSDRLLFDQIKELHGKVPVPALHNVSNENCEYNNFIMYCKNCYMCVVCYYGTEDSNYSYFIYHSRKCADMFGVDYCENCYRLIHSEKCYECYNSIRLQNCQNCRYSIDLNGCQDCLFCSNLARKQYCIENKQFSKEEYLKKLDEYDFGSRKKADECWDKFTEIRKNTFVKFANIKKCEDCSGDDLVNCKNTRNAFSQNACENVRYSLRSAEAKDCYDHMGGTIERTYFSVIIGYSNNILFCTGLEDCDSMIYCLECYNNCKNCFACVGLKHKQYCILNKQYTKEEYEKIVAKIIGDMQKSGEWGNFLPNSMCPFGYNEPLAYDYFKKSKDEAQETGFGWQENNDYGLKYEREFYSPDDNIEEYIKDEKKREELLSGVIKCEVSGRPFKIVPQELAFYMEKKVPIPTKHYDVRYKENFALQNPRKLYHRQCMCEEPDHGHEGRCKNEFETTYAPDRPEKVYCEKCYQQSVI